MAQWHSPSFTPALTTVPHLALIIMHYTLELLALVLWEQSHEVFPAPFSTQIRKKATSHQYIYTEQYFIDHLPPRIVSDCHISAPSQTFGISIQLPVNCSTPSWLFPSTRPRCQIVSQYNQALGHHCIDNYLLRHNKLSTLFTA